MIELAIAAAITVVVLASCVLVIWVAFTKSARSVRGKSTGRCLEPGCGRVLTRVPSRTGRRFLYCVHGHCWVERKRQLSVDVYRYRAGDCPHWHHHNADCNPELVAGHG